MPNIKLSQEMKNEYQHLFDTCLICEDKINEVENIISKINANKDRYLTVAENVKIPWYFVAVIHNMESSLDFTKHLHNGDPLRTRTVHAPKGHPKTGEPPFKWEQRAADALQLNKLHKWEDWSLPGILYKLEEYNGWGYRLYHRHILSPYLWSFSRHYTSGKYVSDGEWSETALSKQAGAAVLLRRMAEQGATDFSEAPDGNNISPLITFSPTGHSEYAKELQRFLNKWPTIYVKVDGYLGPKTSDAFRKVFGYYLHGDSRHQRQQLTES